MTEWQSRAENFEEMCCSVIQMFTRLSNSANRTILYDLYPYIWDIKSIISMVKSFVQWLGRYGHISLCCPSMLFNHAEPMKCLSHSQVESQTMSIKFNSHIKQSTSTLQALHRFIATSLRSQVLKMHSLTDGSAYF